ncbi:alpha-amylase family glycosyl hydrolase [uncultured Treponema sp.]|uniref:alpha-amylase family glycosyl hydrolase n=1 Tax=uncultured Treponema sp. TaxID=162155 RepID=UPI0025E92AEE|nr:alpha-amylase family glycosyl hydrolase [uncultured Treponema sp.]
MKKVLKLRGKSLIAILSSFFFLSCSVGISEKSSENYDGFGSLTIASSARSVNVSSIKFAKAFVSGTGIEKGSEPASSFQSVADGKASSLTINGIPAGKNRVVTVYAYTSESDSSILDENAIVIRKVLDITSGANSVEVSKATTPLANVFFYLQELAYPISQISSSDKNGIVSKIDETVSPDRINSAQIAYDYKAGGIEGLKDKSDYVIGLNGSEATQIVLHVKNYKYVWYWEDGEGGKLYELSADSERGEGWYTGTLNYTSINLLFKTKADWSGSQTADMKRTAGTWTYENGKWSGSAVNDAVSPFVSWVSPLGGEEVSGSVYLFVNAEDESGITKIEYYADGVLLGETAGLSVYKADTSLLSNGTHVLTAKVYDGADNVSSTSEITISTSNKNIPPVAVISTGDEGTAEIAKSFSAASSYDKNGTIESYEWNFGDGSTESGKNLSHTYTASGKYTVTLTVTDNEGDTDVAVKTITINPKGSFTHRDFREETVYFMMTDRFADGDKTNNNIWGDEYLPKGESQLYDYSEDKTGVLSYYHGGDFKGIIDNLDYIADMGFTAIWITPSVKQPEGRYFYDGSSGGDPYQASAFHGYWGYDFDKIDPHLHSSGKDSDGWADYKAFIDACHAKGIRVMQDIVINHGNHGAGSAPTLWASNPVQTIMDGKEWAWKILDPYYEEVPEGSTPSKNGFYSYYGFGQCADLIDFGHLGEDGKDSRHHLINVYKKFIDAGVDAFRIDTMAYIPNEFAGEFADAMYNYAKEKGNDYFYMIGEAWCGRYDAVARHSEDKTDSLHMLDMHLSCLDYPGNMQKVFNGADSIGAVYNNVLSQGDVQFDCMTEDEYTKTAMFVDNHDCYRCEGLFSEEKYKNALNYIYLFRGVPIVYYGTEAMYSWSGTHPSTNKDDVVSRWMLGDVGINYVKQNKPSMYKHLKVLNKVYHASECIQKGAQNNVSIDTIPAAFTRTWNGKTAAVILNHKGSAGSYSFSGLPAGTYTLYTSDGSGTLNTSTVSVSGSYKLEAPANGFAVLDPQ